MSDEFTLSIPVRFRDIDRLNHVNNAVYSTYLEEARFAYLESVLDVDITEFELVIVNLELSFARPISLDDELEVAVSITELGETSWTMTYEFRVDGDVVATGKTTNVHFDPESEQPEPLPDEIREPILEHESLE
ncbi:thioesterase family protein [Halostagnicola sp. A-GB9-2]|uniref:acyl-CoA thioesterase n=1 Tax=Halostagnicola sp. A-GB9-2 TaxID=3048066 RepID=UPI0024C0A5D9|nr:thioesterase family protein [Halostagnicola sp. A-GB9-2]MDJ1430604.1 thioesterase family protein [Halostagnicola sp. A-GB9-2]